MMNISMKSIAANLRTIAKDYPATTFEGPKTVYKEGTLRIKCVPTCDAIEAVAKKYQKGLTMQRKSPPGGLKPSSSAQAAKNFCKDGEYRNAATIHPCVFGKSKTLPIPLVDVTVIEPGIVVARIYNNGKLNDWNVTQLLSGLTCGCPASSKDKAIARFKDVREAVMAHECDDFQKYAQDFYELDS